MHSYKKAWRFIGLALLILLAMTGVGFGAMLPKTKEQDVDNEVKTEIVEGKESEIKP